MNRSFSVVRLKTRDRPEELKSHSLYLHIILYVYIHITLYIPMMTQIATTTSNLIQHEKGEIRLPACLKY